MQTIGIISKRSVEELYECSLCGIELAEGKIYLDEDLAYCKKCFIKVLSTFFAEEVKVRRYGSI